MAYSEKRVRVHGGERYGKQVELDFSVNTNPLGIPGYVSEKLRELTADNTELYEWYPDSTCDKLREKLAVWHDTVKEYIVCGNGASELLFAIVRAVDRKRKGRRLKCCLPVPSFSEYERALEAVDAKIQYYMLAEEQGFALTEELLASLDEKTDLLMLCSPANPTGSMISLPLLLKIAEYCAGHGIFLILDACFLELAEDTARRKLEGCMQQLICNEQIIILKAFTKLYAMAGIRLGYCISSNQTLLQEIKGQLPCWNVSGIAQSAGVTALDNEKTIDYISQTRELLRQERTYLRKELEAAGMRVLPGDASFLCFYTKRLLYERLLKQGILIRDCSDFPGMRDGWYRISIKRHEENERLIATIKEMGE